ncbi:MAG: hypothetical protein ABI840_11905 [bacterium]
MLVSYQDNIVKTKDLQSIPLENILSDIFTGKYKNKIEELRSIGDKKVINKYKKNNLPYFVPAKFKNGISKVIDFDYTGLMLFYIDGKHFNKLKKNLFL